MHFEPTIPEDFTYAWESQVVQYPRKGDPGITYFAGDTSYGVVDCLLFRDWHGDVVGILNHYGPNLLPNPHEVPGNVNVWVRPDRFRRGIATKLIAEAHKRWTINLDQQRFTPSGAMLAEKLRGDGIL